MTTEIKEYREKLAVESDQLYDAIDVVLDAWDVKNIEDNLQFPSLLTELTIQFNWNDKTMRENDPIIRKYIRKHPKWHVTRGAHGGIMRRAEWDKKNEVKLAKEQVKEQIKAKLDAKEAAAKAVIAE